MENQSLPLLHEFDEDEWWDVCRHLRPDLTREEYQVMWNDFVETKRKKTLQ